MLDRTTDGHDANPGERIAASLPPEMLRKASLLLKGRKRLALKAVADHISGDLAAASASGISGSDLRRMVRAYLNTGIAGVLRDRSLSRRDALPMRGDYSEGVITELLSDDLPADAVLRLTIALHAYRGLPLHKIAKSVFRSPAAVKSYLREFDIHGHAGAVSASPAVIYADPEVLRAISASTAVSYTAKRALAVAMWVDGGGIEDIALTFAVAQSTVIDWLKLFERIGLDSLFPARLAETDQGVLEVACESPDDPAGRGGADESLPRSIQVSDADVTHLLKRIDPASLTLEAARTKSYTVKVRLNAIRQVARGKPLAVVERRVKVRSGVVADWVRRYVHSGYKALAA